MWRGCLCGRWAVPCLRNRPAAGQSEGLTDLDHDAAVLNHLFADEQSLLPSVQLRLLNGVHLEEPVEMRPVSPTAFEVVVLDRARQRVDHSGILPARELNQQARRLAAVESRRALDRLAESQPLV